jgi:hypothetical protein
MALHLVPRGSAESTEAPTCRDLQPCKMCLLGTCRLPDNSLQHHTGQRRACTAQHSTASSVSTVNLHPGILVKVSGSACVVDICLKLHAWTAAETLQGMASRARPEPRLHCLQLCGVDKKLPTCRCRWLA